MKNLFLIWSLLLLGSLTATALPTLQEALDGPGFTYTRLGQVGSLVTTNFAETHDGVDAYLTSKVSDHTNDTVIYKSGQRTSVIGPGTLSFWWNVSSELGFDIFGFWMGPTLVGGSALHTFQDPEVSISGTDFIWEQQSFLIAPGLEYLEFVYIKDESDSDGADRGYLDQLLFIPDPPTITNDPPDDVTILPVGTNVTFSVGYVEGGFPSVPNQTHLFWQLNGTNLVGKTNATLSLTNLQLNQSGEYRVVITNLYGSTTSAPNNLQIYLPYPLETALNTTGLVWTTSGDVLWFGLADPSQSYDGNDVARSGLTPDDFDQLSLSSYLQTTVTGPGTLKFWWRLSGLDTDQFYMSVGGFIKTNTPSEDGDWQEATVGVSSGSKVVKFTYLRDDFISTDDSDGAYLDQFRFIPATNAPPVFSNQAFSTDTGFSASIQLDASRGYTIQRSTNLTSWTNVITFTNSDIFYDFADPAATNFSRRYYRIKSP